MIRRIVLLVVLVLVLAGGAAAFWASGDRVGGWLGGWLGGPGRDAIPVKVGTIRQVVAAIGRVEPVTEVTVANKIPGRIKQVLVREGDPVKVGQPIVLFDDQEHRAQVRLAQSRVVTAQAEVRRAQRGLEAARARWVEVKSGARKEEIEAARAELEQARQRWQNLEADRVRFKRLVDDQIIARAEYDRAETEASVWKARVAAAEEALKLLLAGTKPETIAAAWARVQEAEAELRRAETHVTQAQAELEHARAQLASTVVDSTVNGKVTKKIVEPGEAVDISMPLLILGDVGRVIVKAEVDETDVGKLALGQPAEVTADAYPGRVFRGRLYEMGQSVGKRRVRPEDPTKIQDMKVLETKVEVQDGADLKLGMTVDVKIVTTFKDKAVIIPQRLVPRGAQEATVQVAGPAGAEARRILVGARDDEHVEVTAGLKAGDQVLRRR
jgi:ABC exporter DevB family membrane fusion protein